MRTTPDDSMKRGSPPPPPPKDPADPEDGDFPKLMSMMNSVIVKLLPVFNMVDPKEKKRYLKALERADRAAKKKAPLGYGEWGADAELGDDWSYRPGVDMDLNKNQIVDRRSRCVLSLFDAIDKQCRRKVLEFYS